MSEKDVLMSFASKIFAKTDEELAALLYKKTDDGEILREDAFDQLVGLDTSRISRIKKSTNTELFDNGHKKGTKEASEKLEREFKEHTGFDSEKTGMELFLEWGESLKTGLSEDKLKTHPTFLQAEKTWKDKYDRDIGQLKGEFDTFKAQVDKDKKFSSIRSRGEESFMALRPVLSSDPVKAKRQVNNFLESLRSFDYIEQDGELIITRDGQRLETEYHNPMGFDEFIKNNAEMLFDFHQQDDRDNAHNRSYHIVSVKNENDFNEGIKNAKTPEERMKIQEDYYRSIGKPIPKIS
jgi:hypothetical protein